MAFLDHEDESWLEFLAFPGGLFSDAPKLESFGCGDDGGDGDFAIQPADTWERSSWEPPAAPSSACFSTTEDVAENEGMPCLPVLLPASEFVFQQGDKTETLAQRVAPPPPPTGVVVTTGQAQTSAPEDQLPALDYAAVMKLLEPMESDPSPVQSERESKKGKRKLPEVDLESIADPEERKRQKRMAKNRRTAAVSRLRKKARLESLEHEIVHLRQENQKLKEVLSQMLLMSKERASTNLAPQIDELAMLMTVLVLVIMQSAAAQVLSVLMTLLRPPPLSDLVSMTTTTSFSSSTAHLMTMTWNRASEHFSCYGAGRWQQNGIT